MIGGLLVYALSRVCVRLCRLIDHHWRIWTSVHPTGRVYYYAVCDLCGEFRDLTDERGV